MLRLGQECIGVGAVPMPRAMALAASETAIDVDPGELNVDARVEVSFLLES